MDSNFKVGDFIFFWYDKTEKYPGRIISIANGEYECEICLNKRKSSGNVTEIVKGKKDKLEKRPV